MLIFDPADVPLHLAKMCKYAELDGFADVIFVIFALVFIGTRMFCYPYVIYSTITESILYIPPWGGKEYACVGLLIALMFLNAYWLCLLFRVIFKTILSGGNVEDER